MRIFMKNVYYLIKEASRVNNEVRNLQNQIEIIDWKIQEILNEEKDMNYQLKRYILL